MTADEIAALRAWMKAGLPFDTRHLPALLDAAEEALRLGFKVSWVSSGGDALAERNAELAAQNAALTAERDRLATQLAWAGPIQTVLNERHTALVLERDRLAAALRRYGQHDDDCNPDKPCTCGLNAALKGAD